MIRAAHFSDLHLTEGPRLESQRETLLRIATEIAGYPCDVVLLTGDLYGRTVPHRSTPAERGALLDALVVLRGIDVVIVAGNHDVALDLEGLGALEHVTVVTAPERLGFTSKAGQRFSVYGLPYPWRGHLLGSLPEAPGATAGQELLESRIRALLVAWDGRMKADRDDGITPILAAHVNVAGSMLSGGEILGANEVTITPADLPSNAAYTALGHLHRAQEVTPSAWYAGSPWPTDHAEQHDRKVWLDVTIPGGGFPTLVRLRETGSQRFRTLVWRWAAPEGSDVPVWLERATAIDLEEVHGAEVRARLSVPQPYAGSVPWAEELARVRQAGAVRIVEERSIEPVLRARAPEVAASPTIEGKLAAYWSTLATPPTEEERGAALESLAFLRSEPDDVTVAGRVRDLFGSTS